MGLRCKPESESFPVGQSWDLAQRWPDLQLTVTVVNLQLTNPRKQTRVTFKKRSISDGLGFSTFFLTLIFIIKWKMGCNNTEPSCCLWLQLSDTTSAAEYVQIKL